MTDDRGPMHVACFFGGAGQHQAAWRRANSRVETITSLGFHADLAACAERGLMDAIFVADGLFLDHDRMAAEPLGLFEPLTMLSAMAARTEHIGLIGSVSTTFSDPYNVARQFASIDHLSNGRAAWNIVTSSGGEANFGGRPLPSHADRYRRAGEFVDAVVALWDSWADDAIVADRGTGIFADPAKIRRIDHVGDHFSIAGPLNIPRSPQGRPVLAQAGSSEDGKRFAAAHAEIIFTAQQTLESSVEFYQDVKARVAAAGRDPRQVPILPGVSPVIGSTEAEVQAIKEELAQLMNMEIGLAQLTQQLGGVDLDGLDVDAPIPPDILPPVEAVQGRQSRYGVFRQLALEDKLTIRELVALEVGSTGHWSVAGTPEQIADLLQERFVGGGCDGFVLMPPYLPEGLEMFVDHVVPILQQRGLYRTEYEARTLRGNLGIDRPANLSASWSRP
jgi:FMN-dependent oxidoreductase (nitrilotriacetate monooxygenase family)